MSLERDLQSELRVLEEQTITIPNPSTVDGTAIDTQWARAIVFVIKPGEVIDTDVITFGLKESTDNVTFTAVDSDKILPRDLANLNLANPSNGAYQTFGVTSVERYLKVSLTGTTVPDSIDIIVTPILKDEERPWDEDGVDTKP